jgi:gluconate 2-dehydrogenase alpha chain
MVTKLPATDVVLIGFGWTGAILAQQLCDAGQNVVALERGQWRDTPTDFAPTFAQDELRYMWRHHLFQNLAYDTLTIRNNVSQQALPMRRLGSFLLGTGVGGAGVHWNAQIWRFLPSDLKAHSHNLQRYGKAAVEAYDMTIQDYPLDWNELEPHYDTFDRLCGTSGKAGNLKGQIQQGGNPFEGPRSAEYPNPPLAMPLGPTLFAEAARKKGYTPFPHPTGNVSQPYVNPLGVQLGQCTYCGFCEKFACGNYSKATAQTTLLPYLLRKSNFSLRTESEVLKIETTPDGKTATGVTYVNSEGEEFFQPANIVVLSAYILQNVRMLLLSNIGKPYDPKTGEGVVGKNYAYQTMGSVNVFVDKILNPFIGAGALAMVVDEFNGDNFDHTGLGFIGGGYIAQMHTGGRPIEMIYTPPGTPKWGLDWKKAAAHEYLRSVNISCHGSNMAHRGNYLDLDPTYRDSFGRPMLRMTFDFTDNERKMSKYLVDKAAEIAQAMDGVTAVKKNYRTGSWSVVPYQTTHNTGGTIMGDNPTNSVVNKYLQSWDVSNLFVTGAGAFPQNAGYNPTGTVAALAYHAAEAIKGQYLKNPGPLVRV